MSSNSQSNGEESGISIVNSEEIAQQQEEDKNQPLSNEDEDVERLTMSSVNSSLSGSQSDIYAQGDGEEQQALLTGSETDGLAPEEEEAKGEEQEGNNQALYNSETRGRAITRLVVFSIILITVPLSAMYITYRFVFSDHYHLSRDQAVLYSGLVAAALVYAIIGTFAWLAYRDEQTIATQPMEEHAKKE